MKRHLVLAFALLILSAAVPGHSQTITSTQRQQDPRLEQQVTLGASRIYVGALLEQLSAQTGVDLSAGEQDGASDQEVAVSIRRLPLADAIDALWSLLSYQDANWEWRRESKNSRLCYKLVRPPAAQSFADQLKRQVQTDFEVQAKTLLDALSMTLEQLKAAAKDNKDLADLAGDERLRNGLTAFAQALSPEEQSAVLQEQISAQVPVARLSDAGRAFVKSEWSFAANSGATIKTSPDGPWMPLPEPTSVTFQANYIPGQIYPSLFIDLEHMGGSSYVGGTRQEEAWQKKLDDLWILPGDTINDPVFPLPMHLPAADKSKQSAETVQAQRLSQLASAAPVSLMACLPERQDADFGSPDGQRPSSYLERIKQQTPFLRHKWRQKTLLLTYPTWFQEQSSTAQIPWLLIKQFRQTETKDKGLFSIEDLARLCSRLSAPQMQRLSREFPGLANTYAWQELLSQISRYPVWGQRLLSPKGAKLDDEAVFAVDARMPIAAAYKAGKAARLRIEEAPPSPQSPLHHFFTVEALSEDGTIVAEAELEYLGHQFDAQGLLH